MQQRILQLAGAICLVLCLSACVDDDYDLGDIDTTARFSVDGLVVPVNLETVTLSAVLDLEDDSKIQLFDGEYAFVQSGTYESDPIEVPSFTALEPDIDPIENSIGLTLDALSNYQAPARKSSASDSDTRLFYYEFNEDVTDIDVESEYVDEAIISVDEVKCKSTQMHVTFTIEGLEQIAEELAIEELKMYFIPGLTCTVEGGSYDPETGIITVDTETTTNHTLALTLYVTALDSRSGMAIEDHYFVFHQQAIIIEGRVAVYESQIKSSFLSSAGSLDVNALLRAVPDEITYNCQPSVDDIEVISFSGVIDYNVEELNIDAVELTGIPDVLSQTGTNLSLANPQIYLTMNNPVYDCGAYVQTGLTLAAVRGTEETPFVLDEDIVLDTEDNAYCLSPTAPATYYSGTVEGEEVSFADCEHLTFSTLGNILSGDELPDAIDIQPTNPRLPEQGVTDFPLNTTLDPVGGVYVFYAPLELTEDARIVYADTLDDWNDEDVDAIVVEELSVSAEIYTDIPITLDFVVYPITFGGQKITDNGSVVKGELNNVLVGKENTPIEISTTGTVTHLDGIIFEARVSGSSDSETLKADQVIQMENVKATVTGYYEKEL